MAHENNKICRVFKALSEPKRYRIVTMLANGKMSASEILKHFNVTQPTLSRQMADLEADMGVPLLDRSGRKIALTPEGILLRRRAEEIVSLVDKTEMEVSQAAENLEGTISVAGGDLSQARDFVRLIKEFQTLHPFVCFRYYTDITPYICECMDHGCVDVGLLVQPFDREKYESLPIGKPSRVGVYMRADDPLAKKPEVWMQDLEGRPLLQGLRPDLEAMLFARHTDQDSHAAMIESDLPTNLAIMVDEGMGYFIGAEGVLPFLDEHRICFRPIGEKPQYIYTFLAWRRNQPFSRVTKAFIEFLKEKLK